MIQLPLHQLPLPPNLLLRASVRLQPRRMMVTMPRRSQRLLLSARRLHQSPPPRSRMRKKRPRARTRKSRRKKKKPR